MVLFSLDKFTGYSFANDLCIFYPVHGWLCSLVVRSKDIWFKYPSGDHTQNIPHHGQICYQLISTCYIYIYIYIFQWVLIYVNLTVAKFVNFNSNECFCLVGYVARAARKNLGGMSTQHTHAHGVLILDRAKFVFHTTFINPATVRGQQPY